MSWKLRLWLRTCLAIAIFLSLTAAPSPARALQVADRTTPRRAFVNFLEAASAGDFVRASQGMDLRVQSVATRKLTAAELAQQLYIVIERAVPIDFDDLSDDPKGNPQDGAHTDLVVTVPLEKTAVPLTLSQITGKGWLVSAVTVGQIPQLYERYGPAWLEERLPRAVTEPRLGSLALWQWVGLLLSLVAAFALGMGLNVVVVGVAQRITAKTKTKWDGALVERLRGPSRAFVCLVTFRALLEFLGLPAATTDPINTALKICFIGVVAWAVTVVVGLVADDIEGRAVSAAKTHTREFRARGIRTQVQVLRRVLSIAIGVVAAALMLTQFEIVRNVGMSLLASAGVAGVVLGLAAQRTIGSLIAGIQLSITQPVRIGDEVVIEKESGVIEEITLTYVVVKIWDERRLLVPMTHFFEKPFENWTKVSTPLHGTVLLHTHPALPVAAVRAEVDRLLANHPLWDHRTKKVAVTDSTDRAMVVRVLVSAQSAGALGDLRNDLREKLVGWLANLDHGKFLTAAAVDEPPQAVARNPPDEPPQAVARNPPDEGPQTVVMKRA